MMTKKILPLVFLVFTGCSDLFEDTDKSLTESEVVSGLKQALEIGADSAASKLAAEDGYYGDQLVKILLPPEAEIITDNIALIPGGDKLIEDIVLGINRSAEEAAKEATPIFKQAVTSMSINDGFEILRGEDDAATNYLREATYDNLFDLYQPKLSDNLDKELVGNVSTSSLWNNLTGEWNKVANSSVGQLSGLEPVNIELDKYLTNKALDGLFLKLSIEEEKIRTDPIARVTDLLERVFGSVE